MGIKLAAMKSFILPVLKLAVIGGVASLVDYTVLWGLTLMRLSTLIAGAAGYVVGTLIVYFLANLFVFNKTRATRPFLEISFFMFTGLTGLALNAVILELLTRQFSAELYLAKLVSVVVVFAWNTGARYGIVSLMRPAKARSEG